MLFSGNLPLSPAQFPMTAKCGALQRERADLPPVARVGGKGAVGTRLREFSGTGPGDVVSQVQHKFRLRPSGVLHDLVERQNGSAARRKRAGMRIGHEHCRVTRRALPLSSEAAGRRRSQGFVGTLLQQNSIFVSRRRGEILHSPIENLVGGKLQSGLPALPVLQPILAQFDDGFRRGLSLSALMRIEVSVGRERSGGRKRSDSGWGSVGELVAARAELVAARAAAIAADPLRNSRRVTFCEQFSVFRNRHDNTI